MNKRYSLEHLNNGTKYRMMGSKIKKNTSFYHYTNLEALLSIIEHQQLWLTDSLYLNDNEEMYEGVSVLHDALEKFQTDKESSHVDKIHTMLDNLGSNDQAFPNYIASFSEQKDLLSQWRAYGMFCIEFDSSYITNERCVYSKGEKDDLALSALQKIYEELENEETDYLNIYMTLIGTSLSMKNVGFAEEREHRIIVSFIGSDEPVKFRTNGDMVIPYVEWSFDPRAIKAIHIGPVKDKDMTNKSIKRLLFHKCKARPEDYEHIKIVQSKISYRS